VLTIDFETRSEVDIKKTGAERYAEDPTTEILCLAYADETQSGVWLPGDPFPELIREAIDAGKIIEAHNAGFEKAIWAKIGVARLSWPAIPDRLWRCTLAACSRLALPRGLNEAGEALGLPIRKDTEGGKIMLQLSKPRKPTKTNPARWDNSPAKFARLLSYCAQDVAAEMALSKSIPGLTPFELEIWQLDQKINSRGIRVDREAVEAALGCVKAMLKSAGESLGEITGGSVETPTQAARLVQWLTARGVPIPNLQKETVSDWLAKDLPPVARLVLEIRASAGRSSTGKLQAMLDRVCSDGRIRGSLVYHGAATGRWAGAGIQIQNFPRGTLSPDEIEIAHSLFQTEDPEALDLVLGSPLEVVSSSLRSMIIPDPDKTLLVGDFSQIEARAAAWAAGESELVEAFRLGEDPYKPMAAKIYNVPLESVTKNQRQLGKVAILGCQYGLGFRGFQAAVKTMAGQVVSPKFSKAAVKAYREANPKIKAIWGELNTAAIRTIETGQPHRVNRFEIRMGSGKLARTLQIQLPSGRVLHYWDPELIQIIAPWSIGYRADLKIAPDKIEAVENLDIDLGEPEKGDWFTGCRIPASELAAVRKLADIHGLEKLEPKYINQIQYWGVDSVKRKWAPLRTYGGSLFENVVQAIARDFLAEAMLRIEKAGFPIIGTVHDEIICERKPRAGALNEFETLLKVSPKWGAGCPLSVEVFEAKRYRK